MIIGNVDYPEEMTGKEIVDYCNELSQRSARKRNKGANFQYGDWLKKRYVLREVPVEELLCGRERFSRDLVGLYASLSTTPPPIVVHNEHDEWKFVDGVNRTFTKQEKARL